MFSPVLNLLFLTIIYLHTFRFHFKQSDYFCPLKVSFQVNYELAIYTKTVQLSVAYVHNVSSASLSPL